MKKLLLLAFGCAMGFAQADDNILWVDAANFKESCETHEDYEQAGFDGSSAEKAYGTIQAAIDAAEAGWTIKVKPGTYDKGGRATAEGDDCVARVLVTKPLAIVSTGSAADTFIVGAADPDETAQSTYNGCGPNAVRCVRFEQAAGSQANPAVLKGFTIRDGHCADQRNGKGASPWGSDVLAGQPGGVAGNSAAYGHFYVADCVIKNCFGVRGGAARYGRYVRCRFEACNGAAGNSLGREVYCISCLFVRATSTLFSGYLVNCTFADITSNPFMTNTGYSEIYNTLAAHVSTSKDIATATQGHSRNSALPVTGINAEEENCVYHLDYPLFAPLRGDYCVRTESPAATVGNAAEVTGRISAWFAKAPAIVEIRKSYDGVTYPEEGEIPAGCFVKTKSAAGGAVLFTGAGVVCDGWTSTSAAIAGAQYAFSGNPRDVIRVTPPEGRWYFGYKRAADQGGFQYPEMDESFVLHFPPAGIVVTNEAVEVAKHLWVDPDKGVDAEDAGTESKPCKTLAYVMGKVPSATHTLIHAAAGDYNEGVMESTQAAPRNFGRTRVNLEMRLVRLKGAGRGISFITGSPDPDTDPSELDRRGPKAIRCVVLDGKVDYRTCVQGFTIRDGYTDAGTEDVATKRGGLVCAPDGHVNNQVVDCELVGGQAYRAAQVHFVTCTRCIFHGWRLYTNGHAIRQGALRSCLVYDEAFGSTGGCIDNERIYQSTLVHTNTTGQTHVGSTVTLDSSISYMPNLKASMSHADGALSSVFYTLAPGSYAFFYSGNVRVPDSVACRVEADFVDVAGVDFRLRTTSEIFTKQYDVSPDYWKMPATDVYGVPFNFTSGKSVPGAIATPVQVSVVNPPPFGSFESESSGTNMLAKGDSVSVSFTGVESRKAEALLVGGVPVEGFSHTYTYDGEVFAADGSVVRPAEFTVQFSTNWYVNVAAAAGGNGFSPETAWNSLMQIKDTGWVQPGDCVHVARGDYEETGYTDETKGDSCVWIPEGVTVVADEGPDVTRILGKKGTGTNGRGPGAMRCVRAETGATIRNFTLANGYTTGAANDDNALNSGGGILFAAASTAGGTAVGCVITNCVAGRGGAAHYGTLVNCKVLDCWGTACNSSGSHSLLVGCYVDGCKQNQWCRNAAGVYRCTFGPNNINGGNPFEGCAHIDNCVIMRYGSVDETRAKLFRNCLVLDGAAWTGAMKEFAPDCKWFSDYASMGVDAAGHPLSKTAEPVDNGTALQKPAYEDYLGGLDAAGIQRIYNGAIDIGCYEYDWRGVYQTDLGDCATVVTADPQVVETNEGKVLVKDGAITVRFTDTSLRAKYQVPFQVTGTGTLTLKAGDEIVGTYTAADGAQTLTYKNRIYGNDLAFSYAPGENDEGGALLDVQSGGVSGAVLIVR